MRRHILFRVEGGAGIGMGHVMRSIALARALARRGASCAFVGTPASMRAVRHYYPAAACYGIAATPEKRDARRCAVLAKRIGADAIVVDHYRLGVAWEKVLKQVSGTVMAIDDLGRAHESDLLLDANLTAPHTYDGKLPVHTHTLLGPGYALLRRGLTQVPPNTEPRIFISFGGSDPVQATEWALRALEGLKLPVDVLAGEHYPAKDALAALCQAHPQWRLHIGHPRPERLMAGATLAIGGGGTMTWERAALSLPSIVVSIAGNQEAISGDLAAHGVICYLGRFGEVQAGMLRRTVEELLAQPQERRAMAHKARRLVNPHGADRAARRLMECI